MFDDDIGPFSWPLWVVLIPLALMGMCTEGSRKAEDLRTLLCSEEEHKNKKECR
jgi:hypothetical protein